jgi:outer membrane translocation and assembly module TamA
MTSVDRQAQTITLNVDLDVGIQYRFGEFRFLEFDDADTAELQRRARSLVGQVYSPRVLEQLVSGYRLSVNDPTVIDVQRDNHAATVHITINKPLAQNCGAH